MAYGRMIANKIGCNKAVHELSSDTCRLAYTWTLPHLDRDGRIHGNPEILRAVVFPRREDITNDMMRSFIEEWALNGLVEIYDVDGDWMLVFPKFRENQRNMHYDREPKSELPDPSTCELVHPEDIRKSSGRHPAQVKLREEKLREEKITAVAVTADAVDPLYHVLEQAFLSKNDGRFTNYGKEGKAIHGLIAKAKARMPDDPASLLSAMLDAFWRLKTGDTSAKGFWRGQPFLPSALSPLWDRVLETMRDDVVDPAIMAIIKGEAT